MLDFENSEHKTTCMNAYHLFITEGHKEKVFAVEANGNGMINTGIEDGDMLFFSKTDKYMDGDIVAVTVDGETMVRRIFTGRNRVRLRRENGKDKDTYATDYIVHGRLVGIKKKL